MLSFKLAIRNLCRNRLRTLITFLGISLSLALVQVYHNFTTGVYSYMVECGVRSGTGHIAVMRKGYLEQRASGLVFEPEDLTARIVALPGVKTVIPHLFFRIRLNSGRRSPPVWWLRTLKAASDGSVYLVM